MIQPVILCGGSGTRLWPLSRADRPKPFLPLLGERTLFQQTLDRVADTERFSAPLIVAGKGHAAIIREQAGLHRLIVEPCARNTAPAIAVAAAALDPHTVMLVCPSDHFIAEEAAFLAAVDEAAALAGEGWLVTFGITPDRPETGYGYIERGEPLGAGHRVARFVEKPDAARAQAFLDDGNFDWNGGIFAFRAGTLLDELGRFRPDMERLVRLAHEGASHESGTELPAEVPFSQIDAESIDYAVLENTERAAVVSAAMGWSDIGNWDALMKARAAAGLDLTDTERHRLVDCRNVGTHSDGPRISAVGLDDVLIIAEGDEILVIARDRAQDVGVLSKGEGA